MWRWNSSLPKSPKRIGTCLINLPLIGQEFTSATKPLICFLKFILLLNALSSYFGEGPTKFRNSFFPWNKASISWYHEVIFCDLFLGWHILVGCSIHIDITPSSSMFLLERLRMITRRSSSWLKGMIEIQTSFSIIVKCQGILVVFCRFRSIPSYIRLF